MRQNVREMCGDKNEQVEWSPYIVCRVRANGSQTPRSSPLCDPSEDLRENEPSPVRDSLEESPQATDAKGADPSGVQHAVDGKMDQNVETTQAA